MRETRSQFLLAGILVATLAGLPGEIHAEENAAPRDLGWSNSTDLNIAVAKGNANSESTGIDSRLRRRWQRADFTFSVEVLQIREADDRFLLIEPGVTWLPGAAPPSGVGSTIVTPPLETEAARFFVEGKYERNIRKRVFWSTGASWERNEDAGIINRYIAFGGLGRVWFDREDLRFQTLWALSFTDREEDTVDPEKDQRFAGARFSWNYMNKWGKVVVYENSFRSNMSLKDTGDFSLSMTNSISVDLSSHLALKISLRGLFESEPALEDVDVVARVILVDPDGTPGNGDEFFETVVSGGSELVLGTGTAQKDEIDTIFKTSLVIKF